METPAEVVVDHRLAERGDFRMVNAMKELGLAGTTPPCPLDRAATYEERIAYFNAAEAGYQKAFESICAEFTQVPQVVTETVTVKGEDGNDITLYISTPANKEGPLPCVYHTHGGGMSILTATDSLYVAFRNNLAALGVIVVGVEFRNAAGKLGPHQYPAGLNDCMVGLQWVHDHKAERGISKVVVAGESGGGNLSLAVGMKSYKDGKGSQVDGIYSMCPYIYGLYGNGAPEEASLPSLTENNGILLTEGEMFHLSGIYLPSGTNPRENPLAWPFWASSEDLTGLPPVVISVNELDPLRDEGLVFYRKLLHAGVRARARVVCGTIHGGDLMFIKAMPDVYRATLDDILSFISSL